MLSGADKDLLARKSEEVISTLEKSDDDTVAAWQTIFGTSGDKSINKTASIFPNGVTPVFVNKSPSKPWLNSI